MCVWNWAGGPGAAELGSGGQTGWKRGSSLERWGLRAGVGTTSDLHQSHSRAGDAAPHFRDEETGAQRSIVTYSGSHSSTVITKTCTRSTPLSRQLVSSRVEEARGRNPVKMHIPRPHLSLPDPPNFMSGTVTVPQSGSGELSLFLR